MNQDVNPLIQLCFAGNVFFLIWFVATVLTSQNGRIYHDTISTADLANDAVKNFGPNPNPPARHKWIQNRVMFEIDNNAEKRGQYIEMSDGSFENTADIEARKKKQ